MSDITSNLWAHWSMDDADFASTLADGSGNAITLSVTQNTGYPRRQVRAGRVVREFTRQFTSGVAAAASNYAVNSAIDATLFHTLDDGPITVSFVAEFIPDEASWSTGVSRVVDLSSSTKTLLVFNVNQGSGLIQLIWTGAGTAQLTSLTYAMPNSRRLHVALVLTNGTSGNARALLYINGTLVETTADKAEPDTWTTPTGAVGVVRVSGSAAGFLQVGTFLRDLRLYARALTAADVESLYLHETATVAVKPEALAVSTFGEYMLAKLPARVTAINGLRNATLKAAFLGPYTVPASASLKISASREGTESTVSLTSGSRTAAQLATEINAALALVPITTITAQADDDGRLLLQGTAPVEGTPSVVKVGADTTGANAIFGWSNGGEYEVTAAIVAPFLRQFRDGWGDRAPDGEGGRFWLIVRDQTCSLVAANKHARNEYIVTFPVWILCPQAIGAETRKRDRIRACVQAVREVLSPAIGRMLGRSGDGDVMICELTQAKIAEAPFRFTKDLAPFGPSFDRAETTISMRVYQTNLA